MKRFSDPDGRFILVDLKLENTTITLGNIYAPNDDNFLKNVLSHLLSFECEDIRDRSFFMREGGLVGFGGGHSKKIGLKGGAS